MSYDQNLADAERRLADAQSAIAASQARVATLEVEIGKARAAMDHGADDRRWKPGQTAVDALIAERDEYHRLYRFRSQPRACIHCGYTPKIIRANSEGGEQDV